MTPLVRKSRQNTVLHILFRLGLLPVVMLFAVSCNSNSSSTTDQNLDSEPEAEEWMMLWDGKTFEGWRTLGSDSVFTNYWKIDNGILKKIDKENVPSGPDGKRPQGGDLMTVESFENYELSWEWALWEDGNSGLKYNVSEEMSMGQGSRHSALGFEYQMIDDDSKEYADLKPAQFSGSLYDLLPAHDILLKPAGEFNESRLRIDGDAVTHWLNGREVLSYRFGSDELKAAYEDSKFAELPGFIHKRKGHIVLQDHDSEAWFRNIRLKKL